MVDEHIEIQSVEGGHDVVNGRIDTLRALLDAPEEVLETMRDVLRMQEGEKTGWGIIRKLQSFKDVPVVGRIATGVADLLVGNLVSRRTEDLIARGVKPYTGPPADTHTK